MFVQERANFVVWNMERNRAENTDESMEQQQDAEEEEAPMEDPVERGPTEGMDTLMEAMRREQNDALAAELWYEASQIQGAIMLVLEASGGSTATGMNTEVVTGIRNVFQRIWRRARNRGWTTRAANYRGYIDDMHGIMNGKWKARVETEDEMNAFIGRRQSERQNMVWQNVKPCSTLWGGVQTIWNPAQVLDDTHKSKR